MSRIGRDGERLRHRVAERIGHGAGHRRAGRRRHVRIHDPELDPVALAVEAHQVGPERGAAVEAELADALRDLGDQQVVVIELPGSQREKDAVALEVDREDARCPTSLPRVTSPNGRPGWSERWAPTVAEAANAAARTSRCRAG